MAAAPQYGGCIFRGLSTGKTYAVDVYASDVANALINLDGGSGASATSPSFWINPEDVTLIDFFIHTGMTDTTKIRLVSNGRPTTHIIRYAAQLDTSNARPAFNISFRAGTQISAIQLA
jgi:hypothetical protein